MMDSGALKLLRYVGSLVWNTDVKLRASVVVSMALLIGAKVQHCTNPTDRQS